MDSRQLLLLGGGALLALIAIALFLLPTQPAREQGVVQEKTRLVWATAGDLTITSLMQNFVAPAYEEKNPHVSIVTIHTGPGEPGSRLIFEKLKAAEEAGKACWDIDVAVVHQIFMSWALDEKPLLPYAKNVSTWKFVTSQHAFNALGTPIEGYGIALFHSQIAIAYNTKYVKNPPKSYAELVEWVKQNPGKFG